MAETIDLKLTFEGDPPETLHIHLTLSESMAEILDRLTSMETKMTDLGTAMSNLSAAQSDMAARIEIDVAHLQDVIAQQGALLDAALASDASDAAAIADLTAQRDALQADADATVSRINDQTAALAAIDPLTDFPVVEAPPEETPPEEPPVSQEG